VVAPANSAIDVDDRRLTLVARWRHLPMRLRLAAPLGDDDLFDLCAANRDLRIERTNDGELVVAERQLDLPSDDNYIAPSSMA